MTEKTTLSISIPNSRISSRGSHRSSRETDAQLVKRLLVEKSDGHDSPANNSQANIDISAFEQIVFRYRGLVWNSAYRIVVDRDLADDVSQESFAALHCNIHCLRNPDCLSAWLFAITSRLAKKQLKEKIRRNYIESQTAEMSSKGEPSLLDHLSKTEIWAIVRQELGNMPDQCRQVLLLRFSSDLTHREIAQAMNSPLGSVSNQISKACDDLRQRLQRRSISFLGLHSGKREFKRDYLFQGRS